MNNISVYSSEYLHSRNQDVVQLFRHLVLYDRLLLCYFYCSGNVLVVQLAVVVVFISLKKTLHLSTH